MSCNGLQRHCAHVTAATHAQIEALPGIGETTAKALRNFGELPGKDTPGRFTTIATVEQFKLAAAEIPELLQAKITRFKACMPTVCTWT